MSSTAKDGRVAGPFLKYTNCIPNASSDGTTTWFGSVMILTKDDNREPTMTLTDQGSTVTVKTLTLLDEELGWKFWRFDFDVVLTTKERCIEYEVGGSFGSKKASFWVQAEKTPFHFGYTSCNGISGSIAEDHYSRQDPTYLWRDMLQVHKAFPLHCLVGGGDQVYSDPIWKLDMFEKWGELPHMKDKIAATWTEEHHRTATAFYLNNYI